ncbi:SipW-dependent-type signal peptide-containing protein [Cellulosimicrobium sp. NPDC057862]|uniref:SipW-dependent-type signal peptide-containing protein n=1 Tax=Cellulosimicrobium sp. NPDC057862 TaxID=3346266 RepID=UPI00366CEA71
MDTKIKGVVAGVAGGALLLGAGGTFALWHDEAGVAGGTIRSGLLDVETQETRWFDVSPDQGDAADLVGEVGPGLRWDTGWLGPEQTVWNGVPTEFQRLDPDGTGSGTGDVVGHPIDDLGAWQAVPGDYVLGQTRVTARTEGDNMRAVLSLHGAGAHSGDLADALGVKVIVADQDGTPRDQAHDIDYPVGLVLEDEGFQELQVFVLVTFPHGIQAQDFIAAEAYLDGLQVRLEQDR